MKMTPEIAIASVYRLDDLLSQLQELEEEAKAGKFETIAALRIRLDTVLRDFDKLQTAINENPNVDIVKNGTYIDAQWWELYSMIRTHVVSCWYLSKNIEKPVRQYFSEILNNALNRPSCYSFEKVS